MADNEAEPKAGGGLVKKLAIFGGGGILLIAIGLGAGYFIFGSAQPDPSEEIEEITELEAGCASASADDADEPRALVLLVLQSGELGIMQRHPAGLGAALGQLRRAVGAST